MEKVAEVLAGLRDEEARLLVELAGVRRAIVALEQVLGGAPVEPKPEPEPESAPVTTPSPEPPPPGPYATHSLYEAVADYLVETGEPRTARQIAEALQAGGYPTRARDFAATVRTMLQRNASATDWGIQRDVTTGRWFANE